MKKFNEVGMPSMFGTPKKTVSIETVTQSFDIIRIYLPDSINELDEHMDQIEAIRSASENDIIEVYCISNRGGYVDTIVPLCNALATTPAHTVCFVEGHCASAGTFPSMVCDSVEVGAYASFMLHCAQGGTGYGTMVNSAESAKFFEKQYGALLEDIYSGFVTSEEARMLHDGRELYLSAEAIMERLQRRAELLAAEAEEEECSGSAGMRGCEECSGDCGEEGPMEEGEPTEKVVPAEEVVQTPVAKKPSKKKATKA